MPTRCLLLLLGLCLIGSTARAIPVTYEFTARVTSGGGTTVRPPNLPAAIATDDAVLGADLAGSITIEDSIADTEPASTLGVYPNAILAMRFEIRGIELVYSPAGPTQSSEIRAGHPAISPPGVLVDGFDFRVLLDPADWVGNSVLLELYSRTNPAGSDSLATDLRSLPLDQLFAQVEIFSPSFLETARFAGELTSLTRTVPEPAGAALALAIAFGLVTRRRLGL